MICLHCVDSDLAIDESTTDTTGLGDQATSRDLATAAVRLRLTGCLSSPLHSHLSSQRTSVVLIASVIV